MKRTPLKRGTKPMKRTPLRKVSKKRQRQNAEYYALRKLFLARPENQWCPVSLFLTGHRIKAEEVHHKDGREGELLNEQSQWLAVSRSGHKWIHENPNAARNMGWLV